MCPARVTAHVAAGQLFMKGLYAMYSFLRDKYAMCQAIAKVVHDCRGFSRVFDHHTVTAVAFKSIDKYSNQVTDVLLGAWSDFSS